MSELWRKLQDYGENGAYPFHMPGHKRNIDWKINPYKYDITEITGFDDLHHPKDIIKQLNDTAAKIYGADEAFIMVNGSTGGILAAISAVAKQDDKILMARNSHKSAYNAVFLRGIKSSYILPEFDGKMGISLETKPEDVEKALRDDKNIKAVYITSPTYEGVVSDVKAIADISHKYGIPLIVDCAHGAHLGMSDYFPDNPVKLGADIVIMSLHKTLPSMTQTGVVCINRGLVDIAKFKKYVGIYMSSSPSYVLMASIDRCFDFIVEGGRLLHDEYGKRIDGFRDKCKVLNKLRLFCPMCEYDRGKIVISTADASISGEELKKLLTNDYGIEAEMASKEYVIFMTSCMDTDEGINRLLEALLQIDNSLEQENKPVVIESEEPEIYCSIADTERKKSCLVNFDEAVEMVCGEMIYVYPPGIPWLVPGERITQKIIDDIVSYEAAGFEIHGITEDRRIKVIYG